MGAFDRGWLPPFLPESSRDITETNDLDGNTGDGSFQFDASNFRTFADRLTPASPELVKREWDSRVSEGFAIFTHTRSDTTWTLALHPSGKGLYTVSTSR